MRHARRFIEVDDVDDSGLKISSENEESLPLPDNHMLEDDDLIEQDAFDDYLKQWSAKLNA